MIEGFLRGRGQPPAAASDVALEVPQPQSRSQLRWTVVWIISGALVIAAAGFGVRYYLSHRSLSITGEILYKPEILSSSGLDRSTQATPVSGARIVIYRTSHLIIGLGTGGGKYAQIIWKQMMKPSGGSGTASDGEARWNQRLTNCHDAIWAIRDELGQYEIAAETDTDEHGQFAVKLKPGTYVLVASSSVPSFVSDNHQFAPSTGFAVWALPMTVTNQTHVVSAEPACSP